jgi:GTP-binding protein
MKKNIRSPKKTDSSRPLPVAAPRRPDAEFLVSAAHFHQLPSPVGVEYCVMGRSNVGKSSFINHVLGDRRLAKVSKTPGKTSLANLFKVTETMIWVDLPGYGYAHAGREEKIRWSRLISDYCAQRLNLGGVLWLLDIRHPGMQADREAYEWFTSLKLPLFGVFTKCDKISTRQSVEAIREYTKLFSLSDSVAFTITRHGCREEFWRAFQRWHTTLPARGGGG